MPQKMGTGQLRCDGFVTSSGVYEYELDDGSIQREWRPPSEVSDATFLDSLKFVPVTIGHPDKMVDLETLPEVRVGTIGDTIYADTQWPDNYDAAKGPAPVKARVSMVLDSPEAITIVEDKEFPQVSLGYACDLDLTPGLTPDGERYDAIQRRVVANHVAIGVIGRHGPGVAIRVDGQNRKAATNPQPTKDSPPMKKIKIGNVGFDAPEQTVDAVDAEFARKDGEIARLIKERDEAKAVSAKEAARADQADDNAKAAKKEAEKIEAKVQERLKERRALEGTAAKVMGAEAFGALDVAALDDDGVRVAIVKHVSPDRDLTGKDAAYLAAAVDLALESVSAAPADGTPTGTVDSKNGKKVGAGGPLRKDAAAAATASTMDAAEKARDEAQQRRQNAHKPAAKH